MFGSKQLGWIGIDVGTATIKAAQLARDRQGLHVLGTAIVPRKSVCHKSGSHSAEALSCADEMRCALSLREEFRGKRVAISLPMELCEILHIDCDLQTLTKDPLAARRSIETLTQRSAENLQFAIWPTEVTESQPIPQFTNLLAVTRSWSDRIYEDVHRNGWSCQVIDGVPHSLTRAIELLMKEDATTPVAALDWGFGQATFCVVAQHQPVYVRMLKNARLSRLLDAIAHELDLTVDEAHTMLQNYGLPDEQSSPTSESDQVLMEIIAEPLKHLEQEIQRTLAHLKMQRRTIVPQNLLLFGGGALIKGISERLTNRLHLDVEAWRMPTSPAGNGSDDCMFGTALALSALAWETS